MYPKVYLKKDEFIQRKHPWIFSGALKNLDKTLHNQIVFVCNTKGEIVATGYYQDSSIAVKILSFEKIELNENFWEDKIKNALLYRQKIKAFGNGTNTYRLIFGEADGLPGLIIDNYDGHFVMQAHTEFMYLQKDIIQQTIQNIFKDDFKSFYDKSEYNDGSQFIQGINDCIILENHLKFYVNWVEGQKTGFFLDQRDNRKKLGEMVAGKKVLNTFAYSGGFSVYAAAGGCQLVHSVDSSAKAIEWCNKNMKLNGFENNHESFVADVFEFLKNVEKNFYEVIVLDPPAFAKSIHHKHSAVQAYKRLNSLALNKICSGGLIFTFSCSGVIDKNLFYNTVNAACFESNRTVRILDYLHLPVDHPVLPNFPEGEYLKGLILYVE
ncbi:MAG: SAM-dependent methyltransferase [Bacteroidia bacterium]|nr:MAG: SAM-dependent methyltransferase [Bacteroidia bacterium]